MSTVVTSWGVKMIDVLGCCRIFQHTRPVTLSGLRSINEFSDKPRNSGGFAGKLFKRQFMSGKSCYGSKLNEECGENMSLNLLQMVGCRRWTHRHRRLLRTCSSLHQTPNPTKTKEETDPVLLTSNDLQHMFLDIQKELVNYRPELQEMSLYYFDGHGKAMRPMIVVLIARAINSHLHAHGDAFLLSSQRTMAMTTEMIHAASLVHDDVIDTSDTRRGKRSVNRVWGQRKAIMAGDYILSVASSLISRIGNPLIIEIVAQVLMDLVQGEFMQLGAREDENERFSHYLAKTFKKTASLIANSCKAVAVLAGADEEVQEIAMQYGRNVGIAFQLVDDLLDFVSSSNMMGKPTAADLRLGLATAPVLFAVKKFPALNPMIMRRFKEPMDVEKAFEFVHKSNGIEQTRFLAQQHCDEAIRQVNKLQSSPYQKALISLTDTVLHRMK